MLPEIYDAGHHYYMIKKEAFPFFLPILKNKKYVNDTSNEEGPFFYIDVSLKRYSLCYKTSPNFGNKTSPKISLMELFEVL